MPYEIPGFSDPFSSLSHLFAAGLFGVLSFWLIRRAARTSRRLDEGPGRTAAVAVFAASAVLLLILSGVFHLLQPRGVARAVFQRLDHAGIFVLIAGTFTPIHVVMFRGAWRWGVLVVVWGTAVAGVTLKSMFFDSVPEGLGLGLYLGMGWIGAISFFGLYRRVALRRLLPLGLGGLAYTGGAVIDGLGRPNPMPGVIRAHELFHIAVIAGLALHWKFIWTAAGYAWASGAMAEEPIAHPEEERTVHADAA